MKWRYFSVYVGFFLSICACQQLSYTLIETDTNVSLQPFKVEHKVPAGYYNMTIDASTSSNYAHLNMLSGDALLLDHAPLPDSGRFVLEFLVKILEGSSSFSIAAVDGNVLIHSIILRPSDIKIPDFRNVTSEAGLQSEATWKYGGPTIADIDNDGDYDLVLNNHHIYPPQLFWNNGNGTVTEEVNAFANYDAHGTAAGDYDKDGDLDVVLSIGGGNGTQPQPIVLHENEGGHLTKHFGKKGIVNGGRGRSVRWVDMDLDGDLDLMVINAKSIDPNGGTQHLFYRNEYGRFERVRIDSLENVNAERLLITDINNDRIDDIVMFSPFSIWLGNGDFGYRDVSKKWFPKNIDEVTSVAPIDLENDGDVDLYLSRGKPYYFIANKSLDFDPLTGRVDLRDEGNEAVTSVEFEAEDDIVLSGHFLWYRLYDGGFPFHLGQNKDPYLLAEDDSLVITKEQARGWPEDRKENGWYLGHLGNGRWRLEWVRTAPIYWGIRLSIDGVSGVYPDFVPQNRNVQDLLLRNDGEFFTDVSELYKIPIGGNHQGVTVGDINGDGLEDLVVFRFGRLRKRVADWMLINGKDQFTLTTQHDLVDIEDIGHGDMGQLFDFDGDGDVDLLTGSDNPGIWYLYENLDQSLSNFVLRVGNSPKSNVDPISALVEINTNQRKLIRRVQSPGAVHSQSLLNMISVSLREDEAIDSINVKWRNGELQSIYSSPKHGLITIGEIN